jgi:hypothetical protein
MKRKIVLGIAALAVAAGSQFAVGCGHLQQPAPPWGNGVGNGPNK